MKSLLLLGLMMVSSTAFSRQAVVNKTVDIGAARNAALVPFLYNGKMIDPKVKSSSKEYVNICCTKARKEAGADCCATSSSF